jgi:hypothetical protein
MVTIQKTAAEILKEAKVPISAKEIAKLAIEKGLVKKSNAQDPIQSLSQTLERNVRMDTGNNPRLQFINTERGRCLALPEWYDNEDELEYEMESTETEPSMTKKVTIELPINILNKIKIHQLGNEFQCIDDAILDLVIKGLIASTDELIKKLKTEIEDL